jgi:hypothetical protein
MLRQIEDDAATSGRGAGAGSKHRSTACVELLTTAALAVSTAVAMTAVSIGIARADVAGAVVAGDGTPFAVALCIGLLLSTMGGFTVLTVCAPQRD